MDLGGSEDKNDVLRGLLHYFKEGVGSLFGEHMRLVDYINAVFGDGGGEVRLGPKVADIVDIPVAGGVHLGNVEKGAVVDTGADGTFAAGLAVLFVRAVHRLGENFCAGGLADSPASGENIGVTEGPLGNLF